MCSDLFPIVSTLKDRTLLGFDFGETRTGVAVGQETTSTAMPLATLYSKRNEPDWIGISALIREWEPDLLVVGMPQSEHGKNHPLIKKIYAFCASLNRRYGIPVHTIDESFSSSEARQKLISLRRNGRRRRISKTDLDKVAATLLLERWFEAHSANRNLRHP